MPRTLSSIARRRLGAVAIPVAVALALAGCSQAKSDHPDALPSPTLSAKPLPTTRASATPAAAGLKRYYSQHLDWKTCRQGFQCARIRVPLDYAHPEGRSISLALLKVPAADASHRVGSLLVNPGGPGGSGIDFAAGSASYFGSELRQAFDIVGFDPRGVGESTPIHCLPGAKLDAFVASDPDPDNPQEFAKADALVRELGNGCVHDSGALAAHVSTVEAARDVDIIRAALGERRLNWFGASYGTYLGATYADLFPRNVGRMVLDGAIDPKVSNIDMSLAQAHGFEVALRAYVGACVDRGDCFLGRTVDEGTQRIRSFLHQVERQPLDGSGDRKLEVGNAVLGIWAPLYNKGYWPILDNALQSAFNGDGSALLSLSDAYTSRGPTGYTNNSLEALYAVNCLDHDTPSDLVSWSQAEALVPKFEKASPTFGKVFASGLTSCNDWPVKGTRNPGPIEAKGAPPILVVGTTRDPATPLAWAKGLASELDSGVLVTRNGDGHTGYHAGNQCVDHVVESYLVSGTVPKSTVSC